MKAILLNVRNFHSEKKDRDYTVIQYLRDLTPSERDRGYVGSQISEETFAPDCMVGKLGVKDIGHDIDLQYDIIGGKAVLGNIVVN